MRSTVRHYEAHERWKTYRAAASLHAHTHYSREIMADLPRYIARIPLVAVAFEHSMGKCNDRKGRVARSLEGMVASTRQPESSLRFRIGADRAPLRPRRAGVGDRSQRHPRGPRLAGSLREPSRADLV